MNNNICGKGLYTNYKDHISARKMSKIFLTMKLIILFAFLGCVQIQASVYSQNVNLSVNKVPLEGVIKEVRKQTGYSFFYDADYLKSAKPISINIRNSSLKDALSKIFEGQQFSWELQDKTILIKPVNEAKVLYKQQDILISGKVTDDHGKALHGASVNVTGEAARKLVDANGDYKITVKNRQAVLTFSYLGFKTKQVKVGSQDVLDVTLERAIQNLEETVVVAYGTVKREDLTGSVGTVKVDEIAKAPVTTFTQALAGRVAGLQVSTGEGQPGMLQNIVIRGPGSLTQDPSPLYVVDGFPVEDFNPSVLNSNDIESISVLKDASAAALYGSRAANGVIVIETVKGKSGKPQVALNGTYGLQSVRKKIKVMDAYEFVKYQDEFDSSIASRRYFQNGKTIDDYKGVKGVDWQDRLFQTGRLQMYDISIRGGNLYTQYAFSGSLFDNEGIILNTGATRRQGRISLNHTFSDKVKVGTTINYSHNQTYGAQASQQAMGASTNSNSIFYPTFGYRPISGRDDIDLADDDIDDLVDPNFPNETRVNPVKQAENTYAKQQNRSVYINGFISYQISKELLFKATGNVRDITREDENFYNSKSPRGLKIPRNDKGVQASVRNFTTNGWLNENTLTFNKAYSNQHRLNALLGFSVAGGKSKNYGMEVMNIPNENLGMSGISEGTPYLVRSGSSNYTMASFFSRLNYNYRSKYLVTGTFRTDGSSKFPSGNKWGYFPSGAFAWNVDKEEFFKQIRFVSSAKLRTSWGLTGNNRVSDFGYLPNLAFPTISSYSFNNGIPTKGAVTDENGLGNDRLKWETTEQIDVGVDLVFFKKRIELTADLYRRTTRDMLLHADLPYATGYNRVYQNIGKLKNEGLELSLSTKNVVGKEFSWESNINISFNRNKILALTRGQKEMFKNNAYHFQYTESFNVSRIGEPAGQFYGYEWIGNYQYDDFNEIAPGKFVLKNDVSDNGSPRENIQPGDIKYKDINGDTKITDDDKVILGRALPNHFGGFNNNFSYKNFDLNVFFQWSYGNHIYNANRIIFEGNSIVLTDMNQFSSYQDRWTPDNQNSPNYRTRGGGPVGFQSSRVLEDGSYLRLKTVALSYNLPAKIVKKMSLNTLSVNLSAQNLLTWTNYTGFDPEVAVRNSVLTPGLDFSAYPHNRTFVAGVKASF